MELKYVGAKPKVSHKGVNFDQTKPDRFTFLNAAVELLEALSFETVEEKKIYLQNVIAKERSGNELMDLLKKHCVDPEEAFTDIQEKTNELIERYAQGVKENDTITADERRAWLGNIDIMRDYYLQYITNESAYRCALNALAGKIHNSHIDEISVTAGRNHGLVLSHMIHILRDHKPPYDATLSAETKDGQLLVKMDMNRAKPLDI